MHDFIANTTGGFQDTFMPAMVRAPQGIAPNVRTSNVGTYLVGYSGLPFPSGEEAIQIVRVDNPLTSPAFYLSIVNVGDIDDRAVSFPEAPQNGTAKKIHTNNRRALDAVWVNNELWMVTTVVDSNSETSAYWLKFNANGVGDPTFADGGPIDGEDIGKGTFTYFASLDVNSNGVAAFGFAASSPSMYAGAYATIRDDRNDPNGTVRRSEVVQEGLDKYFIVDSKERNRWGDYTGMALDPVEDNCFWAFNEYAGDNCTFGILQSNFGCWKTAWARLATKATRKGKGIGGIGRTATTRRIILR